MWTEERLQRLKCLWRDGLSASQIAQQLGGVTRNAVLGQVHRQRLSGRKVSKRKASTNGREKHREQAKPCKQPESTVAADVAAEIEALNGGAYEGLLTYGRGELDRNFSWRRGRPVARPIVPGKGLTEDMKKRADKERVKVADRQAVEAERTDLVPLLIETERGLEANPALTANACRWPIGEPIRGFCGRPAPGGKPYCSEHHARSYQPVRRS